MEYEKIKQLMEDMGKYKLASFDLELSDGTKISMKKQEELNSNLIDKIISQKDLVEKNLLENLISERQNVETKEEISISEKINNENKKIIKSPMVGTFYSKPSPTSDPYTEIGKQIQKGDVVCIVEAMKLMNEIESEFDGRIVEILLKDGDMVEYGSPIFVVE